MPAVGAGAWLPHDARSESLVVGLARGPGGGRAPIGARRAPWRAVLLTVRPKQWIKNALVVAAAGAAGALGHDDVPVRVGLACVAFCLLASGIYAINDVRDAPEDRLHPRKRFRPVAAGELDPRVATLLGVALVERRRHSVRGGASAARRCGGQLRRAHDQLHPRVASHRDPRHRRDRRGVRVEGGRGRGRGAGDPVSVVRARRHVGRGAGGGGQAPGRASTDPSTPGSVAGPCSCATAPRAFA